MAPKESEQSPAEAAPAPAERSIPEEARRLLRELAAEWEDVAGCGREPEVVPLKGAMTNEVYQARWPTGGEEREARTVLVRVYGEGVELFFDREDEVRTFECMSRHGHGPRLLGRFPNGRVEEFIHARVRIRFFLSPFFANHFVCFHKVGSIVLVLSLFFEMNSFSILAIRFQVNLS
jgi:choline/ethanolamine kinase